MKLLFMNGSTQRDMSLGLLFLGLVYKHNQSIERTTFSLSFTIRYLHDVLTETRTRRVDPLAKN